MKKVICIIALLAMACVGCAAEAQADGFGRSRFRSSFRSRAFVGSPFRQRVIVRQRAFVPLRQRVIVRQQYVAPQQFLELDDGCHDAGVSSSLRLCVWSDTCVNLAVFDANGNPHGRTSVLLLQDDNQRPSGGSFCEWMPYQKGQAAKYEALEKDQAGKESQ